MRASARRCARSCGSPGCGIAYSEIEGALLLAPWLVLIRGDSLDCGFVLVADKVDGVGPWEVGIGLHDRAQQGYEAGQHLQRVIHCDPLYRCRPPEVKGVRLGTARPALNGEPFIVSLLAEVELPAERQQVILRAAIAVVLGPWRAPILVFQPGAARFLVAVELSADTQSRSASR